MRRLTLIALLLAGCDSSPEPAAIQARINPSRTWYHTGQDVMVTGVVTSIDGEDIPDVEVAWTIEPASAGTIGSPTPDPRSRTITLSLEGTAEITGCVVEEDPDPAVEPLCDSLIVRVDDGMPSLEVTSPQPGDQLDGDPSIAVEGSVADQDMVNVYINGVPAEVDPMGGFRGEVPARFGVNHLVVSATDGLTDVSEAEMDVLWAPEYMPAVGMDGTPRVTMDDGLRLWLGQGFFDDGMPLDPDATPVVTRDLADVLELVVANLDVQSLVPSPVVDDPPTFTLSVSDARVADPTAELDVTEDGIDLFLRIGEISADTSGALMVDTVSLPLTGQVRAGAVAFAHLTVRKDAPDAELEVTLGDLTVGLERVEGDFVSDETDAVFLLAAGLLRTTLETVLVDALRETLDDSIPEVLRDALGAIDTALQDQQIELDSEPFPPVTIELDGRIGALSGAFRRELLATLALDVGTDVAAVHPDAPGVPIYDPRPALPFVNEGSIQLGVRLALLNGLLHALWNSGLLEVDASALLPDAVSGLVSEARLIGRMPPVLRPAREDEEDDLVLTVGQLELELTFMGEPVRFAVSIDAGVNLDVIANAVSIDIAEEPTLRVWTLQAPSNPRLLTSDTVETLLLDLWPDLRDSVAGGLSIDLPLPSLGDLGGLAPDLAGLTLELSMTERVRPRRGVLELEAEMLGTL